MRYNSLRTLWFWRFVIFRHFSTYFSINQGSRNEWSSRSQIPCHFHLSISSQFSFSAGRWNKSALQLIAIDWRRRRRKRIRRRRRRRRRKRRKRRKRKWKGQIHCVALTLETVNERNLPSSCSNVSVSIPKLRQQIESQIKVSKPKFIKCQFIHRQICGWLLVDILWEP